MNPFRRAVVLGLFCGPLLVGPAEAMAVKCRETPGAPPVRLTPVVLVVNGEVMGDLPAPAVVNGAPVRDTSAIGSIKTEDIFRLTAVCLEITEAGVKVRRSILSLITRDGVPSFMSRFYYGGVVLRGMKPDSRLEVSRTTEYFPKR